MSSQNAIRLTGVVLALVFVAIGAGLIVYGSNMRVSPIYAKSGPQIFPWLIGALTALVGIAALAEAWRGRLLADNLPEVHLSSGVIMAAGILFQILTIKWLGWIPTSAIVLICGAQAMRRGQIAKDILVGLLVGAITYYLFSHILGLRLPLGSLFG